MNFVVVYLSFNKSELPSAIVLLLTFFNAFLNKKCSVKFNQTVALTLAHFLLSKTTFVLFYDVFIIFVGF